VVLLYEFYHDTRSHERQIFLRNLNLAYLIIVEDTGHIRICIITFCLTLTDLFVLTFI